MSIAAKCPNCGASLSEAAVLALAPVCLFCKTVLIGVGGSLGLTGVYGVSDPNITRRRIEADRAVFQEYKMKYSGMLQACLEQLGCSVERYADLPQAPEFLELGEVPSFWKGLGFGVLIAPVWLIFVMIAGMVLQVIYWICNIVYRIGHEMGEANKGLPMTSTDLADWHLNAIATLAIWVGWAVCVLGGPVIHFRAKAANGNKPLENARRQEAYEHAKDAALKAAEPIKGAEDYRLRLTIREVEALALTVTEKEAELSQLLARL